MSGLNVTILEYYKILASYLCFLASWVTVNFQARFWILKFVSQLVTYTVPEIKSYETIYVYMGVLCEYISSNHDT
jgi:hypothetical protein